MANKQTKQNKSNILIVGILLGIGIGAIIFSVVGIYQNGRINFLNNKSELQDMDAIPVIGKPAPEFVLNNIDGQSVRLSDLKGQPVALNFWATWCSPCVFELPLFQEHYEKSNDGFQILAINNREPGDIVIPFVEELGLTFEILLDLDAEVAELYQVIGFPTTYFIDSEGIIRVKHVGVVTENQFSEYLSQVGVSE